MAPEDPLDEHAQPKLVRCPICKQEYDDNNLTLLLFHSTLGHEPQADEPADKGS